MKLHRTTAVIAACGALAFGAAACGDDEDEATAGVGGNTAAQAEGGGSDTDLSSLSGSIRIDGSSTVEPLAEAAIELFNGQAPDVRISLGGSGTGAGFEKFCRGETEISDASRAIEAEEWQTCVDAGIEPVEIEVAIDGLSVIAHPDLKIPDDCLTTAQLKKLLSPGAKIDNYAQLGAGFPDQAVSFFTPGPESGTYDYFTEELLETDKAQRTDKVQTSANDNQIVTGISGTKGALGYVGFAFAEENRDALKILAVDAGKGCVKPTLETIATGEYAPLSRPLFMYPSVKSAKTPAVKAFLEFVNEQGQQLAEASGYIGLPDDRAGEAARLIANPVLVEKPKE